ncbi:hypothetical protein [Ruegeria aquimaris]|uniref:HTH cro/C1-type domain-containing protein n=1 Tax=Ruegeria aquimaris TaxID=2984333 RepID=A0ABT3AGU2_9RHOB|nr:hypothetical protein [Ruegeria sp. XHP0148]MCV2887905.1 hypothetical protein [Ruegeria sp. XHP0148]
MDRDLFADVGEEAILVEVEKIINDGAVPSGRAARDYYTSGNLPTLMEMYFRQRGVIKRNRQALFLGVSAQTLNKIYSGADISENMLFRFRIAVHRASLRKHYSEDQVNQILEKPWRPKNDLEVNKAVMELLDLLSFILEKVNSSNSLGAPTSIFSDLHRAQLISLLKESIAKLESPVVNIQEAETTLSRTVVAVKKGLSGAIEAETRNVIQVLVASVRRVVGEFLKEKGFSSFSDFF